MDEKIQTYFENLASADKELQYEAYVGILEATKEKVDWAYEVWDELVEDLTDRDHHKRSRAAQFLSSLAISDPEKRMLADFPKILEVTYDKKFVTARHTLQSLWKIALAGVEQRKLVMDHFIYRFENCEEEKNYTLIRFDIIQGIRHLYDELQQNETIRFVAMGLIEFEKDSKYQKKYAAVWK